MSLPVLPLTSQEPGPISCITVKLIGGPRRRSREASRVPARPVERTVRRHDRGKQDIKDSLLIHHEIAHYTTAFRFLVLDTLYSLRIACMDERVRICHDDG
jgi:hypothetical protein